MEPNDFVYQQIYKGSLAAKVNEGVARGHAVMGLDSFKKGKFTRVDWLIRDMIIKAKKVSKGIK